MLETKVLIDYRTQTYYVITLALGHPDVKQDLKFFYHVEETNNSTIRSTSP